MNSQGIYSTSNLKLAAALATAGFEVLSTERIEQAGRENVIVDTVAEHNGHKAENLAKAFDNFSESPFSAEVERMLAARGVTPEEQTLLFFDAARTAGHNRVVLLKAAPTQPLKQINAGGGRMLQFRAGTKREDLKKLCR